jgi:inositol transport system ATP-binding protein
MTADNDYLLQAVNLTKSFPGVQALAGVRLDVEAGKVHAVMGENGAGKSTLMKILVGLAAPDSGEVRFKGQPVVLKSAHAALKLGIAMIHQELLPFPELTVAENIFMGQEPTTRFPAWVNQRALNTEARRLLERLAVSIAPTRRLRELSVAAMQSVEIAKALAHDAQVILMDEPTSALSEREVTALFKVIRDLKEQGVAVIYISHKMEEVFRIADTVTVLRDGQDVGTYNIQALDQNRLIALMVGKALDGVTSTAFSRTDEMALAVRGLSKAGRFHNIDLEVRRGEIVGLAGLMGAGRTELIHALYGLAPADAGEIWVKGELARIRSPQDALAHGMALVSEDRKQHGLVLGMSVKHNLTLSNLPDYERGFFIDHQKENRVVDGCIHTLRIKTPHRNQPVKYLSGGHQQKVVLARALLTEPDILLLDEPTRGIDIGAKQELHALIRQLARNGKAILMASSELPEILGLSDRILVMRDGQITAELDPAQTTQEEIMRSAMSA